MFSNTQPNLQATNNLTQLDHLDLVTILEASPNGIYLVDAETLKVEYANPTALKQLGYPLEELQQMTPLNINAELTNQEQLQELIAPLMQGEVTQINFETTHRCRDGTLLPIELYLQLINQGNQSKFFAIAVDISQRKDIEKSLDNTVHQLKTIADHIPGIIYQNYHFSDGTIQIKYINGRVEEILGRSADKFYADISYFLDLIHEADRANFLETIQQTIPKLHSFFWEGRLITPSNQMIWIQIRAEPQLRSDGIIVTNGVLLDITAQKKAELALKENETIFRQFAENLDDILWMVDLDMTQLIYVSPAYEKIWGDSPDKLKNNPSRFLEKIHPEDQSYVEQAISKPITQKQEIVYRIIRPDGEIRWLRDRAFPIPNEKGETYRIAGIAQDITKKRRYQQEISHYRQLRDVIFNEATDALFLIDPDTLKILDCNKSAVQLLKAPSKADLRYKTATCVTPYYYEIKTACEQQGGWHQELSLSTMDGNQFWGDLAWQNIQVAETNYYLVRITDITANKSFEEELKQTNDRLEATNQELEKATRLKDEFLANMSHELKTPLNAILGLSEALKEGKGSQISDREKRAIENINVSANHLLSLINDILDLAKMQTGKVTLDFTETSIQSLCETSLMFVRQQANEKQIELTTHINTDCDTLNIDEFRIRQVLINLLTNAVKFTPEGGQVTLTVNEDQSREHIIFSVSDTGIGIPSDQLEHIFEPFYQLDGKLNRNYAGTGLGLPLVRRLIELHEGNITVESQPQQGSTFYVKLPYSQVCLISSDTSGIASRLYSQQGNNLSTAPLVLLASADHAQIDSNRSYLEACGYQVISVTQIEELPTVLTEFSPHVIVIDIETLELEAEKIIEEIQQGIPILMMNATNTHHCCNEFSNVYCLKKPIRLRYLRNEIQNLLPEEFQS